MVRIPVEYQEVEYLESSGTQYIRTDIVIDHNNAPVNCKIILDSMSVSVRNSSNIIISYGYTGGTWFGVSSSQKLTLGGNTDFVASPFNRSTKIITYNDTGISVSIGDEIKKRDGTAASNPIYLFSFARDYPSNTRIYSASFYMSDVLTRNLIPCYRKSDSEPGMYDTVTKQFFTNAGTGTFLVGNDVSRDTASLIERRRQILLNTPHLATASANPLTFQTDISANLKDCKIYFEPVQEGSGDPSPDNVRPISGWDGVTITRCGKNLAHFDQEEMVSTGWNRAFPNPFKKAGRYVMSCQNEIVNGSTKGALFVLSNNAAANPSKSLTTWTFGSTSGQMERAIDISDGDTKYNYIVLRFNASPSFQSIINAQIQIEENSSATSYEPYTGTSLTLPFPKTLYGGYVDLAKGEVVETDYCLTINETTPTVNIRKNAGGRIVGEYALPYNGIKGKFVKYSHGTIVKATTTTHNYQVTDTVANDPYNGLATKAFVAPSNTITATADFPNWIADVAPLQVVYELATPITHQIADGLNHITLGQDISPMLNGRSSTGGYANSTATGIDGCKFVYFELGWPTEAFLQYSADISRRSEFVSDSRVFINGTTTDAKLGEMIISTGSATDYDGDALVYLYVSVPSDCTDLASKRAYLAEHPIKITYPKKTPIPYTVDLTDLKPVKGTNNIWSNANSNIEVKFWKH